MWDTASWHRSVCDFPLSLGLWRLTHPARSITYRGAKDEAQDYQTAKDILRGLDGPFRGWVRSGPQWEQFDVNGVTQEANTNTIE